MTVYKVFIEVLLGKLKIMMHNFVVDACAGGAVNMLLK